MATYDLDSDEAVILKTKGASVTGSSNNVDLILTNKNLIQVNKGFFGGTKAIEKFPLTELKTLNGKANVLVGKDHYGNKQLEVYFSDAERFYQISGVFAESKWENAIIKAHKDRLSELSREAKKASGNASILGSVKDTLNNAIGRITDTTKKNCKCPKCGAELIGRKGEEVKCIYCDTITVIK